SLVELLKDAVDAEVHGPSEQEIGEMPCVARVDRRLVVEKQPLSAERVLECHTSRSLVVTNQVAWAQELFAELERLAPDIPKCLLHSLFFSEDRAAKEKTVREWFGPQGQT